VTGEGVVGLAVYEEADAGDLGECGVQGADDGLDGEGFDLDAGRVVVDEGAAQVDDGELARLVCSIAGRGVGIGEEEDVVYRGAGLEGVDGVGLGVGGQEMVEEGSGADGGVLREREGLGGGSDGGVGVVGEVERDVLGAGGGGCGDGGVRGGCAETLVRLFAAAEEEGNHEKDGSDEAPEEDALVARDHRDAPAAARVWLRQEVRAATMAFAMVCW